MSADVTFFQRVAYVGKAVGAMFSTSSYPLPPGAQNNDNFERNRISAAVVDGLVGPDRVLRLSAVWACIRLLAETISTLPLMIYERKPDGSRVLAPQHPLYELLHSQPNADMTAQSFWEAYCAGLLLQGDGYGRKRWNGRGDLIAIDLLLKSQLSRQVDTSGRVTWKANTSEGIITIPEEDMFHTPGFSLNGRCGLSAITYGAMLWRNAYAQENVVAGMMENGLQQTVAFSTKEMLKPAQREEYRTTFKAEVGGSLNAGKPVYLEGGTTAQILGINPDDAQLLESRSWTVEEICRWFRVPPILIGHGDKTSSWPTSTEAQGMLFLQYSLRPLLTRIEQSIRRTLMGPGERSKYFAEFAIEGLLRADSAARSAFYASSLQNGWLNRNEVRGLENWPKIPDGGDTFTVQSNLTPLDLLGSDAGSDAAKAREALKSWLDGLDTTQEAADHGNTGDR